MTMETKQATLYRLGKNPRWYRSKSAAIHGYAQYYCNHNTLIVSAKRIERLLRRLTKVRL